MTQRQKISVEPYARLNEIGRRRTNASNTAVSGIGSQYRARSQSGVITSASDVEVSAMSDITREEMDAKLAATKAEAGRDIERVLGRVETLASELRGDFREVTATLNGIQNQVSSTKSNIWAATAVLIAAIALIVGVTFVVGPWAFGVGAQMQDMVNHAVEGHFAHTTPEKK